MRLRILKNYPRISIVRFSPQILLAPETARRIAESAALPTRFGRARCLAYAKRSGSDYDVVARLAVLGRVIRHVVRMEDLCDSVQRAFRSQAESAAPVSNAPVSNPTPRFSACENEDSHMEIR